MKIHTTDIKKIELWTIIIVCEWHNIYLSINITIDITIDNMSSEVPKDCVIDYGKVNDGNVECEKTNCNKVYCDKVHYGKVDYVLCDKVNCDQVDCDKVHYDKNNNDEFSDSNSLEAEFSQFLDVWVVISVNEVEEFTKINDENEEMLTSVIEDIIHLALDPKTK